MIQKLGCVKCFDGGKHGFKRLTMYYATFCSTGNKLYLPIKIFDTQQTFCETIPGGDQQVTISIIYKKQMSLGHPDCLHLYNVLFKKIMRELLYIQMGRNYFNPQHKSLIPQHKLEVAHIFFCKKFCLQKKWF